MSLKEHECVTPQHACHRLTIYDLALLCLFCLNEFIESNGIHCNVYKNSHSKKQTMNVWSY